MNKAMLTGREYDISFNNPFFKDEQRINWYSSLRLLRSKKSVKMCDFYNTMNSGGNWEGYIVQELHGVNYLIIFSQENNYPMGGFTVWTNDNPLAGWKGEFSRDEVETIISDYMNELWEMQQ